MTDTLSFICQHRTLSPSLRLVSTLSVPIPLNSKEHFASHKLLTLVKASYKVLYGSISFKLV